MLDRLLEGVILVRGLGTLKIENVEAKEMIDWIIRILAFMLFFWILRKVYGYFKKKFSEGKKSKEVKMRVSKKEQLARRKRMFIVLPLLAIVLVASSLFFYNDYLKYYFQGEEITTNKFTEYLTSERPVEKIVVLGNTWSVKWQDDETINKINILWPVNTQFTVLTYLSNEGAEAIVKPPMTLSIGILVFLALLFAGIIVFVIFYWPKMLRGGGFIKTLIKGLEEWSKIKFSDVGALKEVKKKLSTVIEFLKDPKRFTALGARMPRGILLSGPPGCGKTYIARALAGEAGVPYFSMAGPEFTEMFVGVGASRVRLLFDKARANAPCIVFLDEIDAFAKQRSGLTGDIAPQEEEDTLRQLLSEMDGFDSAVGILVLAATNRPEVLDSALLRPGRFDIKITLPRPDRQGRKEILEVHAIGKPLKEEVDFDKIAGVTSGLTGADLESIINEAALRVAKEKRGEIEQKDLEYGLDRVTMGQERKGQYLSQAEKEIVAYHEAGHALVVKALSSTYLPEKISIIPRVEGTGGFTRFISKEEHHILTKKEALAILAAELGGRAGEIVALDLISTGAAMDLQQVTQLAKSMVCFYGMSERIGPRFLSERFSEFAGIQIKDYSEYTAKIVDEEIDGLVSGAFKKAKEILQKNKEKLEKVKGALIASDNLSREEFNEIVGEVT